MSWQFHGPCAKSKVVVTDSSVRYRNTLNKVLAVSIDTVDESVVKTYK